MFSLNNILKCPINQIRSLLARQSHNKAIPVAWTRPEIGWTKLNFDGSSKGKKPPGRASIGGVLRDHDAKFLLGFAEPIGRANSSMAELTALIKGLELVLENGWKDVWLEGDAKGLVEIIVENREVKCVEARSHIGYINCLIQDLNNCKVTHVYREGNRVANRLASIGHRYKKLEIWRDVPPLETLNMMREDAEGKIIFRKRITRFREFGANRSFLELYDQEPRKRRNQAKNDEGIASRRSKIKFSSQIFRGDNVSTL